MGRDANADADADADADAAGAADRRQRAERPGRERRLDAERAAEASIGTELFLFMNLKERTKRRSTALRQWHVGVVDATTAEPNDNRQ
jgi:hypothetical protein